ncbi:MAG: hypothetical protein ACYSX0_16450 [Planctomycetota bacterium]|jgi:lipid A oxidase
MVQHVLWRRKALSAAAIVLAVLAGACSATKGEYVVSAYGGTVATAAGDLRLVRPDDTHLTFADVAWHGESFTGPIFYGFRGSYWFQRDSSGWGINVDFTHAKAIAHTSQVAQVYGTKSGLPVDGKFPIRDNLEAFEMSHGLNFLTVNGMYRWFLKEERDKSFLGRLQFYLGGGLGIAFPHVEATVDGDRTQEYQLSGPAAQGFTGFNIDLVGGLSTFLEYKLTAANNDLDLNGGGTIEADTLTSQFILGLSWGF